MPKRQVWRFTDGFTSHVVLFQEADHGWEAVYIDRELVTVLPSMEVAMHFIRDLAKGCGWMRDYR